MGYSVAHDMGMNHYAIKHAVRTLSGTGRKFSLADIALELNCDPRTIERNMPKLIEAGEIYRQGSNRTGFRYFCREES